MTEEPSARIPAGPIARAPSELIAPPCEALKAESCAVVSKPNCVWVSVLTCRLARAAIWLEESAAVAWVASTLTALKDASSLELMAAMSAGLNAPICAELKFANRADESAV